MPALPITGVQLVVKDLAKFNTSLASAGLAIANMNKQTGMSAETGAAAGKSFALMGAAIGGVVVIAQGAIRALAGINRELVEFASSSFMTAARVEELDFILQALAGNAGLAIGPIREQIKEIKTLGIRTKDAQELMANFIRFQIDLKDATLIAAAAQDFATIAQKDSSETLANLTQGIIRLESRMIRTSGATIDLNDAYRTMALELGKDTDALTIYEKRQAAVNAVIENAATVAGAYDAAMFTVGKRIRSLPRLFADLQENIGRSFLPGGAEFVGGLGNILEVFKEATAEGGKLHTVLFKLGAVFAVLGDAFESGSKQIGQTITNMLTNSGNRFIEFGEKAFNWGINFIAEFAGGIIEGAATAMVWAMNAITSMLTFWMSPGSPPRVAPNIDKWGIATMTEYLKGFADADYSVLSNIQKPLQSALSFLASEGLVSPEGATQTLRDLTKAIAESISKTGTISAGVLDKIARSAGAFGVEIASLAKLQSNLAIATEAVNKANEDFIGAGNKVEEQQMLVSKLVREFNELRRSGASKDILKLKRDELEAAEAGLWTSRDELKIAEARKEEEEDKFDVIKAQASAQQKLVEQLLQLSKISITAGGAGAGKLKDEIEDLLGGLGGSGVSIDRTLNEAFERLKASIREKFATMFQPITDKINELIFLPDGALYRFKEAWSGMSEVWSTFKTDVLDPFFDSLVEKFPFLEDFADDFWFIVGAILALGVALWAVKIPLAIVGILLGGNAIIILAVVAALALLKSAYDNNKTAIIDFGIAAIETIIAVRKSVIEFETQVAESIETTTQAISNFIVSVINAMIGQIEGGINSVIKTLNRLISDAEKVANAFMAITGGSRVTLSRIKEVSMSRVKGVVQRQTKSAKSIIANDSTFALLEGLISALKAERNKSVRDDMVKVIQEAMKAAGISEEDYIRQMGYNSKASSNRAPENMLRSTTINNNYNYDVSANYQDRQSPETISNDMQALLLLARGN